MISPPRGLAGVLAAFGDIRIADGKIVSPIGWEDKHMVLLAKGSLAAFPGKLYVNRAIVSPLLEAMDRVAALGWQFKTVGCFNPRVKRGTTQETSMHAWGIAIDCDADDNPLILDCPPGDPRRKTTIPMNVIQAFKDVGWQWGGDFYGRFDPMHFQWAKGV